MLLPEFIFNEIAGVQWIINYIKKPFARFFGKLTLRGNALVPIFCWLLPLLVKIDTDNNSLIILQRSTYSFLQTLEVACKHSNILK